MPPREYLDELFSLQGLVAVVTGGSSGIGRAIAAALAGAGARVVLVARDPQRLDTSAAELTAGGCQVAVLPGDLSTRDGVHAVCEALPEAFGEPDVLVNSAGINVRPPLGELDEQVWDATMAVNLEAPFLLGQWFGPAMARRGFGRIINVSSQQAHRAFFDSGSYGVSKGGLEALTRSQAEAWSAQGVTSNALVPGFVMTPLNTRLSADPDTVAALAQRTLVGRNGLADDFAGIAVFLAGRSSGYITGQSIFVDGGMSVH